MSFRKVETQLNSDEQVLGYIEKALALVEDLDPPEDLRGLVFQNACNLYSSKNVQLEQIQPGAGLMAIPRGAGR